MNRDISVFEDIGESSLAAAEHFVRIGGEAIEKRGRFTVALAGGSTPKLLYRLLSSDKFKDKINWKAVFFFFGDERNVSPDADESNFRMADETLFQPLQIPSDNIYRWETELEQPEKIAEDYGGQIKFFFQGFPRFDLILLGMGDDGHTASLFPLTSALNETRKIAAANFVEKLDSMRLTLTFPVINNARNVIFLVSGSNKAKVLREVLEGDLQPKKFPSQKVKPENGRLFWLIDKPAAGLLTTAND